MTLCVSEIFNDTKPRAVGLRQLSFLSSVQENLCNDNSLENHSRVTRVNVLSQFHVLPSYLSAISTVVFSPTAGPNLLTPDGQEAELAYATMTARVRTVHSKLTCNGYPAFLPCDAMHSAAIADMRCPSVCLSVCHVRELRQNE